jgi:hypothetical protein
MHLICRKYFNLAMDKVLSLQRASPLVSFLVCYCNVLVGSIHDGTLLHSKFNTQLLITISSSEHTYNLYSFSNTTTQVHSKSLYISRRHNHSNVSVLIVALIWKRNKPIVTQQGAEVMLPRKPNMEHYFIGLVSRLFRHPDNGGITHIWNVSLPQ